MYLLTGVLIATMCTVRVIQTNGSVYCVVRIESLIVVPSNLSLRGIIYKISVLNLTVKGLGGLRSG